ncbi:hypothetical protein ABZ135_34705 [Streptomyces sp. NPDC006339]|uniref:zinc finger domain-containing protein n=1 Tax=Streptomyces sp. NPDC006339 TaxID=3156755 RepID=UPI0033A4EDD3
MNPDEAAKLLGACAAFDNRQPSQIAMRAWATSLKDVPLDEDCFEAVARYYGTPPKEAGQRLWIQPHDVRSHRDIIRKERLENFVYEGDPNETGEQYLANYRRTMKAVASGRVAGPIDVPALEGSFHPNVLQRLQDEFGFDSLGQPMPGDDKEVAAVRRPGPLSIECPVPACGAPIGRPCKSALRSRASKVIHPARRRAAAGEPVTRETPEEIEQRRRAALASLERIIANQEAAREEARGE